MVATKSLQVLVDRSVADRMERNQIQTEAMVAATNAKLEEDKASARAGIPYLFFMFPLLIF